MQSDDSIPQEVKESNDLVNTIIESLKPGGVLLVTSKGFTRRGVVQRICTGLTQPVQVLDNIDSHPQLDTISYCFEQLIHSNIANVIGLGGGSVIDVSKVIAGLLGRSTSDFSQVIKNNIPFKEYAGRLIAIPTTSGTGAEVTGFATLWDRKSARKYSVNCAPPDLVLFAPELCLSLSRHNTLYAALDAVSHAVESLWNVNRTKESEELALQALQDLLVGIPAVLANLQDREARRRLQWAAWRAGCAINITKTAVAHAISYPLTLQCGVPHGLACSFTLKAIIEDLGAETLKIPTAIADNLREVLTSLSLDKEMRKFNGCQQIVTSDSFYLDPSRAGNFVIPVDSDWARKMVMASL